MNPVPPIHTLPIPDPDHYMLYALVSREGALLRAPDLRVIGSFSKDGSGKWRAPALLNNGEHGMLYDDGAWKKDSGDEVGKLLSDELGKDYESGGNVKTKGWGGQYEVGYPDLSKPHLEYFIDWIGEPGSYEQAQLGLNWPGWVVFKPDKKGVLALPRDFLEPLSSRNAEAYDFSDGNGIVAGISRDRSKILYFNENAELVFELRDEKDKVVLVNNKGDVLWTNPGGKLTFEILFCPSERDLFSEPGFATKEVVSVAKELLKSPFKKFHTWIFAGSYSPPDYFKFGKNDETIDGLVSILVWYYRDEHLSFLHNEPWALDSCYSIILGHLKKEFGEPLDDPNDYEGIFEESDRGTKSLWKIGDRYLVLESFGQSGDSDYAAQVALVAVPQKFYEWYDE